MQKLTFEVTEEELEFLQTMSKNMAEQDNRGTAQPYFYVIMNKKHRVIDPRYYTPEEYCVYDEHGNRYECASVEEYISIRLQEYEDEIGDLDEGTKAELTLQAEQEFESEETVAGRYDFQQYTDAGIFWTEFECHEWIRRNKHHLYEGAHSYVKYGWRNYEMEVINNLLRSIHNIHENPELLEV